MTSRNFYDDTIFCFFSEIVKCDLSEAVCHFLSSCKSFLNDVEIQKVTARFNKKIADLVKKEAFFIPQAIEKS